MDVIILRMLEPVLQIVIVNWNSGALLDACLRSLDQAKIGQLVEKVTVVDNGSTDGSDQGSSGALPLSWIRNPGNRGFAAACNQGVRTGQAPYILFLNPDTRVSPDAIPRALERLSLDRQIGICGIQQRGNAGAAQKSWARFPSPTTFTVDALGLSRLPGLRHMGLHFESTGARSGAVDHVSGAFYLVRRELFAALGGFDERYFMYFEDLDFSLRARKAGWKIWHLGETHIWHIGGGTSGRIPARRLFYVLRSRLKYARKHFSAAGGAAVMAVALLVEPLTRLLGALLKCSPREAFATVCGYVLLWGNLREVLEESA